ncbi:putative reverse transcriptase domain-containing protein [Tanacetum coccineum]|uniref:Reverse transcriptase domain-containing protein n=1 Tax=Tanacetum coccineum TaxID=301880 RepID=A0ABQ4Y2N3_9ASTR
MGTLYLQKTTDAFNVAQHFIRDVVIVYMVYFSIVSDRDTRFLSHFWRSLWKMVNTQLNFSRSKYAQAEFAHNHAINRSTGFSPFQVVYSAQPRGPLDLMTLPVSGSVPKKVAIFVEVGEYNKLSTKKIGPLEIIEKIDSNAYRLKLPSHIRCFDVFNVKHLFPYHGDSSDDDS